MTKSRDVFGIKCKNPSQQEAFNALLNPERDLVVICGASGAGKTLLAMAAGLEQVLEKKQYTDIMITRSLVSVGEEMGHLPGDVNDKMYPWLGAFYDNLEFLIGDSRMTESIIKNRIKMVAMQFIRGRSFNYKYIIVDETQNLTVSQLKVLLTRAGEGTKIVCLGCVNQCDMKNQTGQNALAYLIDKANNCPFAEVVHLPDCVRSRLSKWADDNIGE